MLVTYPVDLPSDGKQGAKPYWFDLVDPTGDDRASVERATGLKLPTREHLSEVEIIEPAKLRRGACFISACRA